MAETKHIIFSLELDESNTWLRPYIVMKMTSTAFARQHPGRSAATLH